MPRRRAILFIEFASYPSYKIYRYAGLQKHYPLYAYRDRELSMDSVYFQEEVPCSPLKKSRIAAHNELALR